MNETENDFHEGILCRATVSSSRLMRGKWSPKTKTRIGNSLVQDSREIGRQIGTHKERSASLRKQQNPSFVSLSSGRLFLEAELKVKNFREIPV
ncbi:hypothetical protein RRG08_056843 [Elysia crispata]|uniref:Uncharacterized protein n=1 Tax=Elysia crispata TaxID=231223 RepID=A0AAE1DX87_9GAST|nr:hypothetical protein RRG08_056843 [Elysia crispata]